MRILVVEDEVKLANAVKRSLELQQYAVDVAYDGEEGLDLAGGETYDLIVLDMMLPRKDGMEICRVLRASGNHTPILILTARGQTSDKVAALDTGADDYMVKPFSLEELFARVRALVRRGNPQATPILSAGDLTLDPTSFKVRREGKAIDLSAKEFAILEYLLRHKGSVVTKEQVVGHVWDYDADVLPGTVEVHVKHLRDKMDVPFRTKLIRTVRGFGYEIGDGS